MSVEVVRIETDAWQRLRLLRLEALQQDPEAFTKTWEQESTWTESQWRRAATDSTYLVVARDGQDVSMMAI